MGSLRVGTPKVYCYEGYINNVFDFIFAPWVTCFKWISQIFVFFMSDSPIILLLCHCIVACLILKSFILFLVLVFVCTILLSAKTIVFVVENVVKLLFYSIYTLYIVIKYIYGNWNILENLYVSIEQVFFLRSLNGSMVTGDV